MVNYIRLFNKDVEFIREYAKENKLKISAVIKAFVHNYIKKLRFENAVNGYKEGKMTIRDGAELSNMSYHKFLNELMNKGLIGSVMTEQEETRAFKYFK